MTNTKQQLEDKEFNYVLEQFADVRILRYTVPGFDGLELNQKKLVYFLSQASLCGRDILTDQNGKYNLYIRRVLESINTTFKGDRSGDNWNAFSVYLKRIWFSNGIYHHYSSDKITPDFTPEYLTELISNCNTDISCGGMLQEDSIKLLNSLLFDQNFLSKKLVQDSSVDIIEGSAVNFYGDNVSQKEVEDYYSTIKDGADLQAVSHGLNSQLIKEAGSLKEVVWKSNGMYGEAIDQIIYWLTKAVDVAETPEQKQGLEILIEYYRTGDLKLWDDYNVSWVKELKSHVDYVNGFVEVYSDPLGMKATWEAIVNFIDIKATKRTEIISSNAQWFEDHSPVSDVFKKKKVVGVSAKVINVAMLGGDCYPHTPIGINLPNSDWIRKEHGSKSVTIENITYAYSQADLNSGFLEEFSVSEEEMNLEREYGALANNLHTDLHECVGHGSGQLLPGVSSEALKNYHSPLEETRADLFSLYFMLDPQVVKIGLLPTLDAARAHYISYIRNGLMTQLRRIDLGKNVEQAHMRNRQLIAQWAFEKGKKENVIGKIVRDNKTFFKINDFDKLRGIFGQLLAEVQRIKSEGDYNAGKNLVESYGVKVDKDIHAEVLGRFDNLNMAAFSGFVNPEYELIEDNGEIKDVKISYVANFAEQMLKYSRDYSFLPVKN